MPNIAKILKEEISRISRKEAKAAVSPTRKPSVRSRKDIADIKRRVALLEQANRLLLKRLSGIEGAQPAAASVEPAGKAWISGKGIKSLRKRLGLSQVEFAKLVGVSSMSVMRWEQKPGMLKLRGAAKASVFSVRKLGAREARERLAEMANAKRVKKMVKKAAPRLRKKR
jgi:DNA-binding transcriptional regulator YiaG